MYYPFNGNSEDFSGNGFHGTPINVEYSTGLFGDENGCGIFNGLNSRVTHPFLTLTDSSTLAGWFYSETDSQATPLIYNGHTGQNGYGIFIKKPLGSFLNGYWGNNLILVQGGVSENVFNSQFLFPKNQWQHVALVRHSQYFELYVNGIFQFSGPLESLPPQGFFSVGSSPEHIAAGYPSFKGKIDEVMIFKSSLTADAVYKVYQANLTSNKPFKKSIEIKNIWPNPMTQNQDLFISLPPMENEPKFSVLNHVGKLIVEGGNFERNGSDFRLLLNQNHLPKGFYILKIENSQFSTSETFLIN